MIKRLSVHHGSATWEIDGHILGIRHLAKESEAAPQAVIGEYKNILNRNLYELDNTGLCKVFLYLGGKAFAKIGCIAFHDDFLRLFTYFCRAFLQEWSESEKSLPFSKISVREVFEIMFRNKSVTVCYDFKPLIRQIDGADIFYERLKSEYYDFWAVRVSQCLSEKEVLSIVSDKIGASDTVKCCVDFHNTLFVEYLSCQANQFTLRREIVTADKMLLSMFGRKPNIHSEHYKHIFKVALHSAVKEESQIQRIKFIQENPLQFKMDQDKWIIYYEHGPSIYFRTYDFSVIQPPGIRQETKYYVKHLLALSKKVSTGLERRISYAVNWIAENNPGVNYLADISETDVIALKAAFENSRIPVTFKNKTGVLSISSTFQNCNMVMNYLMSDWRDEEIKSPVPRHNPFKRFVFRNLLSYHKNTAIIPESVAGEIEKHLSELNEVHQLYYKIFSGTGMRASEVLFLRNDCLEKCKYDEWAQLKYKPNKIIAARRRKNLGDYHRILIPHELAGEIKSQIKASSDLRKKCGLPYIFLSRHSNNEIKMFCIRSFVKAVNRLIKRHGISEHNDALWHFTSRQCRKTIAVTLIENGATIEELAYWLGHLSRNTAARYYAEIRKIKLAALNTAFYKQKFDLLLSDEQLQEFSEEERRLLYIDFRLDQRRVEFGHCLRKIADGGCNYRNSMYNCINCKYLCTGRKYLNYWKDMLLSQKDTVDAMLEAYRENSIEDYSEFKEYIQEKKLLESYQNIVRRIESEG